MRYRWPDGKQSAVVLSFDFDAESGFLFREPEKAKRSLGDLEEIGRASCRERVLTDV